MDPKAPVTLNKLPRVRIALNDHWFFQPAFNIGLCDLEYTSSELVKVRLPHTVVETPFNYFSEDCYQMVSGYRRVLEADAAWQGKVVKLTFEGAAHKASVYVNGHLLQVHSGGYTAFTVDLTDHLKYGESNVIAVELDSRETLNMPPFGHVIDFMTYGGLYREVFLEILHPLHIEDVFVRTENVLETEKTLKVQTALNGPLNDGCTLCYRLYDAHGTLAEWEIKPNTTKNITSSFSINEVTLWSLETPQLYWLETALVEKGHCLDSLRTRFGFREAIFKTDGFYLNGNKLKLRGLNRHQSYPYVGYAMPKGPQIFDAELLKNELRVNTVRTSHYPQSQYFIDRCDEIGLLVFTELPGWQHIGNGEWQDVAISHVAEMVTQYRNHPSVILWGVRINESQDDDVFYTKTNTLAHALDPSRQTGGVRYMKKSNLLEDVYTYNDFLHQGNTPGIDAKKTVTSNPSKGYLVSEFNGHMYPTKSFDTAVVRTEHAHRHARVLNDIYAHEDVAGGIGWCLFDYNTHKDFGSGDRICYHGVMDMFRNPKLAAAVYASQGELLDDNSAILEVGSEMGIGDYPSSAIGSISVFSNADQINVYKNDVFIKRYAPDCTTYANLPHPPFKIDDLIGETMAQEEGYSKKKAETIKAVLVAGAKYGQSGLPLKYKLKVLKLMAFEGFKVKDAMRLYGKYIGNWGAQVTTYTFEALKNGQSVKKVTKAPVEQVLLKVSCDQSVLAETTSYEVATCRIAAVDQNGNVLTYYQEPLALSVTGNLELIGPSTISLKGGMGGTYVKSIGKAGTGQLTVTALNPSPEMPTPSVCLTFEIEIQTA